MTGPSTMAHHQALHARVKKLEVELAAAYHKKPSEHNPAVCPVCREAEDDGSGAA